jgi:class 3 adenylate cyclase
MPILNIETNDGRSYNFPISKDKITIGRTEDCDLTLSSDKTVSRRHAQIEKTNEGYLLTDLGSYNRTKVNERLVQSVLLKHNDKIRIGRTNLTFSIRKEEELFPEESLIIKQNDFNEQIREEEILRNRLERFLSPQVTEIIVTGSQETIDNVMEAKELTATMLFTDIIGFTRLVEQIPLRETNMILNQYLSTMTDIIFSYDGTLDKYIGDGLMAVFGAPIEREDDAERAILAAKEMREKLSKMMAEEGGHRKKLDIRIGINTGRVAAGNIGSRLRMDYTVIGDPVNIASILRSIAEPSQILIGEDTYRAVKGKFKIRKIGPKKVKEKSVEIMVYEIV